MLPSQTSLLKASIARVASKTRFRLENGRCPRGDSFIHIPAQNATLPLRPRVNGHHAAIATAGSVRQATQVAGAPVTDASVTEVPVAEAPVWHRTISDHEAAERLRVSRLTHRPVLFPAPREVSQEPLKQHYMEVLLDGKRVPFDCIFLRDACTCPKCVDPHSKQRLFRTADIPEDIRVFKKEWKGATVEIIWRDDIPGYGADHVTRLPLTFFHEHLSLSRIRRARHEYLPHQYWDREVIEGHIYNKINYEKYMTDDSVLRLALLQLNAFGLLLLKDVPHSETAVESIGGRIGPLRDSFYGKTWDVKSVPKATNVAYTHQNLGLHMDLLYMKEPPTLQLLHCLRASSIGGASYFVDSYFAARKLRSQNPSAFHSLLHFPVTYHYYNAGEHYHQMRPTIVLEENYYEDEDGSRRPQPRIAHINWSPPFQGPFEADTGLKDEGQKLRSYLRAARQFARVLDNPDNQFEYLMQPGECVIFNNRRVLHARRAFDGNEGVRWLKGAYLDSDPFISRIRVLNEKYDADLRKNGKAHREYLSDEEQA